jgi:branched-chain amino acid transport system ATP-binding protein
VTFGALKAVDRISLAVRAGERRALIGPNGAGKTTLFNAIGGTLRPNEGRIVLSGRDITRASADTRARLGVGRTFQITNLFPTLTVGENMELALHGIGRRKFSFFGTATLSAEARNRVDDALARARLSARIAALVKTLSYGEQRQLELAMALAQAPRLLLLDEPAAGLSPAERGIVAEIIGALPRDITIVLIEHDMDLVLSLVDWVTCLNNGQFLAEGSPADVRRNALIQDVYLGRARA